MASIMGWDIGGVNIKAARLTPGRPARVALEPFELQRAPARLGPTLARIAGTLGSDPDDHHAVTMTAELSQFFRTKREGVEFVVEVAEGCFGSARVHLFGTDGSFHSPAEARARPLEIAAANWLATAQLVAQVVETCLLIDIGSTTTDLIPIVRGEVVAAGRTDPDRLASGELVYTGAVRTPAEAVAHTVPLRGATTGVSAERFALMGDVHVWLGELSAEHYTVPTPDGRPATRSFAGERLARVVCGDRELLSDADIDAIARALASAQTRLVLEAMGRVLARHPVITTGAVTGLGDFMASRAAKEAGLSVTRLADRIGEAAAVAAPATAVATLLEQALARAAR
jgi:probable H4MPT-linked C1 transfer pathway protein